MIDQAKVLDDLKSPPANHFELLKGDRKGQHSIRITKQWRICFIWKDGHAHEVEIIDYHSEDKMTIKCEDLGTLDLSDVIDTNAGRISPTAPGDILRHEFWLGLQNAYDLEKEKSANDLSDISPIAA